ncbi:hypothetical protein N7495_000781 [Penicillium taxi]|uniref:uncharacterized protein n=1 Tax=Penicillium taxi TaxID=168475 RepID=UPI002545B2CD|nr:uncharacterized protein N7495_000781 [Penicillium taxi]KAJ5908099.1 hypothetical protein N7495_000781 [Penicillium taxi]
MSLSAARGPDHPPPSKAEKDRIRELSRYYCTFNHSEKDFSSSAPQGDEQPGVANLSPDIALNAIAQLGVLRFGANRSFVSIIDGQNQLIIAEATGSISLRNKDQHLPDDGIYLGFISLDLAWGVCPHTIKLFTSVDNAMEIDTPNITANRTRYIIRNFTAEECFRDRPYVVGWPHMRFYAEVPLFSPSGHVLGSYCIVDDSPRSVFGDTEVASLQEVADAIAQHLENTRIVHYHRRAEKLVKGVTEFVTGHSELIETEQPAAPLFDLPVHSKPSADDGGTPEDFDPSDSNEETSLSSSYDNSENTGSTSPMVGFTPVREKMLDDLWNPDTQPASDDTSAKLESSKTKSDLVISKCIASIFSRASTILLSSMELDGVLFVDAYRSNSGTVSSETLGAWEPLPKVLHTTFPNNIPPDPSKLKEGKKLCDSFGHALRSSSESSADDKDRRVAVTEELLQKMITVFPHGQIFNMSDRDDGADYLSYGNAGGEAGTELQTLHELTFQLSQQLPEVDSVLFLPLWDWNKSRWLAGTLVWSSNKERALGLEELGFFKAFSNSIISEVARAEWEIAEKSKSDFISSVSHELRSPLHGILGNAELLQQTDLSPAQGDMLKMIESCGSALLDVVNHLLDFTKINNLTRSNTLDSDYPSRFITVFDLGALVEEATEMIYTSQMMGKKSIFQSKDIYSSASHDTTSIEPLTVIVRIEELNSFKVRSVAGAWTRIVMSLVSNSMKWTQDGFIEVSLSNVITEPNTEPKMVLLSVKDTGCGISPDFLKHSVFSPFAQEDSLQEGVGLGLSIVHSLVSFLGGDIKVKSELGVGTQVDITVPIHIFDSGIAETTSSNYDLPKSIPATRACLIGFDDYPGMCEPLGNLSKESKRKVSIQSFLSNVFLAQPNWSVSFVEAIDEAHGKVAIIEETKLHQLMQEDPFSLDQTMFKSFIVLGDKSQKLKDKTPFNWISQPYGPRKLRNAIKSLFNEADFDPNLSEKHSQTTFAPELIPPLDILEIIETQKSPEEDSPTSTQTILGPLPPNPVIPELPNKNDFHVLIVDDNNINLKIIATFMNKIGCTYESATNGLIALEKYKESTKRFKYVLMDLSMPVMDGLVSTSKIREFEKESRLEPARIMAVTGVASAEMQKKAQLAGIDDYLIKPVSLQSLKTMMT